MVKRTELSLAQRESIVTLHGAGFSLRQIMSHLKLTVALSTVSETVKRFRETGSNESRCRSGRPRATTAQEDLDIVLKSKRNRMVTAPDIKAEINSGRVKPVSTSTVQRRLREKGLKGRIAAKKPLLRKQNIVKRLRWAREHRNWTVRKWNKVVFSDESKFELFGNKRRVFVRRQVGERMSQNCVVPTVKHGGGAVMVWGCFGGGKVGDLVKIQGIMRKEEYHSILQRHAVPSGKRLIGRGFIFQQDNDPKHASNLCKNYLGKKEQKGELLTMVWPPQSPDLSPIELLWDELDRKVRLMRPKNVSHLWDCLQKAWKSIAPITLRKLIERMPKVCAAVIKAKGGYFEESKLGKKSRK